MSEKLNISDLKSPCESSSRSESTGRNSEDSHHSEGSQSSGDFQNYGGTRNSKSSSKLFQITRRNLGSLWQLIARYSGVRYTPEEKTSRSAFIRKKAESSGWLRLLAVFPWFLTAFFLFSFYWDFDASSLSLFGNTYSMAGLLRIVTVSGLIGFLTNRLAITMLFRPAEKRPLLGHGLIPAQKDRIAQKLAAAVSEDLINPDIIMSKIRESDAVNRYRKSATKYLKRVIDKPGFREELKSRLVACLREIVEEPELRKTITVKVVREIEESLPQNSFERIAFRTYNLIKGRDMQSIIDHSILRLPDSLENELGKMDEFLNQLPQYIEKESEGIDSVVSVLIHQLVHQLNVFSLVKDNISRYDEGKLEQLIKGATHEQLLYIQYLGALLGTIGGLVIWQPVLSLTALVILATTILALDKLLLNWRKSFDTGFR